MENVIEKKYKSITIRFYTFFRKHLFLIACILFLVSLPFRTRITNLAIILMSLAWLLDGGLKTKWKNLRINKSGSWVFVFYGICLASVLYSANIPEATGKLVTKIPLVILPLMVYSSSLTLKNISVILGIFVGTVLLTAFYCLGWATISYIETADPNSFFYHWFTEPLYLSPIYFANFLGVAVIILLLQKDNTFFSGKWKVYLILLFAVFILMLAALAVTGFLVCLGVLCAWHFFRRRFSFSKTLLLLVVCGVIFAAFTWMFPYTKSKIEKINDLNYEMNYPDSMWNTVTIRLAKWRGAAAVIRQHPVLGVGVGDEYDALMESYAELNFAEGIRNTYNEHNQYLASLVATGMPGLMTLLAMLLFPLRAAAMHRDYLLSAFLALMLFSFMTENFLYIQKGILFFSFFYALLIRRFNLQQGSSIE